MDGRRDVIDRLGAAGIGYFVTGSEAMAVLGLAYRATNDIDLVLDLDPVDYESRLRPAFEPDYLVAPLLHIGRRWMGSAIRSRGGVYKADFIIRDPDPWGADALRRATDLDDPDRLDAAYLRRRAADLGMSGLLEEAIRRAAG